MPARAPSPTALRRFATPLKPGRGLMLPVFAPAVRGATTLFPTRVFGPAEVRRVLKDGHQSRKIGKVVAKGSRRGWPIFTLTLEERATCPRSCREWQSCYGNNMQAAERIVAGADLERALTAEVAALAARHPGGFLVRLHVLGDFYSTAYVNLWADLLRWHPALHLFGFTARDPADPIGRLVNAALIGRFGWGRAAIRFSGQGGARGASRVIEAGEIDAEAVACPAQTGATDCCATCALCWHSQRSIAFGRH